MVQRTPPPPRPLSDSPAYSASSTLSLPSRQRHLLALLADASAAFVLSPQSADDDDEADEACSLVRDEACSLVRDEACSLVRDEFTLDPGSQPILYGGEKTSPTLATLATRRSVESSDAGDEGDSDYSIGLARGERRNIVNGFGKVLERLGGL